MTQATDAGFEVGKTYTLISTEGENSDEEYVVGNTFMFEEDDGSSYPMFVDTRTGVRKYPYLTNLSNKALEDFAWQEQTPAQRAGFIIGNQYECSNDFEVLAFVEDDGSEHPWFVDRDGNWRSRFLWCMTPYGNQVDSKEK